MRHLLLVALILTVSLASITLTASLPDTYYVAPWGGDNNPGTRDKPWKSPRLATRRMKPGDTLVILEGKYVLSEYDADILMPPSGRADAWTVVRGEGSKRPVLAGRDNLLTAIDLSGKSYVRIENLEITSDEGAQFRDGIEALGGPVSHVVLKDLHIHHVDEMGINIADAEDLKIINCSITHCGFGSIGGPKGEHGGWRNVLIQDCYLAYAGHYYQGGPGPSPYDRPDGFGIEPSKGPVEIARTVVEHNRGDGLDSKADNTYIHGCVVANNFADGVKLWGPGSRLENTLIYGRGDGSSQVTPWSPIVISSERPGRFEIVGVTVDDQVGGNYIMHVQYDYDVPIELSVKNTIFSGRGPDSPIFVRKGVKFEFDGCLFYFPKSGFVLTVGEEQYGPKDVSKLGRNFYGDPMFVRTGFGDEGDYHLRKGSPAIDSGVKVPLGVDLEGCSRPQDAGYDIGAYEFGTCQRRTTRRVTSSATSATGTSTVASPSRSPQMRETVTVIERVEGEDITIYLLGAIAALLTVLVILLVLRTARGKG